MPAIAARHGGRFDQKITTGDVPETIFPSNKARPSFDKRQAQRLFPLRIGL